MHTHRTRRMPSPNCCAAVDYAYVSALPVRRGRTGGTHVQGRETTMNYGSTAGVLSYFSSQVA